MLYWNSVHICKTDIGPAANLQAPCDVWFEGNRAKCSPFPLPLLLPFYTRVTPGRHLHGYCVLNIAYCVPFILCFCHAACHSHCQQSSIVSSLCGGGMGIEGGGTPKGGGGKLLTPSTNGNELVLHCATWPAANLIQLVGIGMRLNGIYLFNCRAPRSTKPFLLNHFTQIESQLALQLELHHTIVCATWWECSSLRLALFGFFAKPESKINIYMLHCTALCLNKSGADWTELNSIPPKRAENQLQQQVTVKCLTTTAAAATAATRAE